MKLKLWRETLMPTVTLGKLYIDGVFECHTLEDCDRKLESGGTKIAKETAIPKGRYPIIIDFSQRFQKPMLHVMNVPQFEGIRIHAGNSAVDTEGCILLGMGRGTDRVFGSRLAVDAFFQKISAALSSGAKVTLEVV